MVVPLWFGLGCSSQTDGTIIYAYFVLGERTQKGKRKWCKYRKLWKESRQKKTPISFHLMIDLKKIDDVMNTQSSLQQLPQCANTWFSAADLYYHQPNGQARVTTALANLGNRLHYVEDCSKIIVMLVKWQCAALRSWFQSLSSWSLTSPLTQLLLLGVVALDLGPALSGCLKSLDVHHFVQTPKFPYFPHPLPKTKTIPPEKNLPLTPYPKLFSYLLP